MGDAKPYRVHRYGNIVALVCDGEELVADKCGSVWSVVHEALGSLHGMDRRGAVCLSVLLYALEWSPENHVRTLERWRALTPSEAYWLGRKAEKVPAWRAAIGVALGEDHERHPRVSGAP